MFLFLLCTCLSPVSLQDVSVRNLYDGQAILNNSSSCVFARVGLHVKPTALDLTYAVTAADHTTVNWST